MDYKLIFTLVFISCLLGMSCVFAGDNVTCTDNQTRVEDTLQAIDESALAPDVPDLVSNDTFYVNSKNIESYFPEGTLDSKYENKTLIFMGDFEDVGVLAIKSDYVTIKGDGSTMKNTVFDISANNVALNNIKLDLNRNFPEIEGAAVYLNGNNISLVDLNINYVVPYNVDAYVLFGYGLFKSPYNNLKIINSTFYFEAQNVEVKKYNCAVKLTNFHNSLMENTTIIASFPLNEISFNYHGADLDSDYIYNVGIEGCDNFVFKSNEIISDVSMRPSLEYPTLDAVVLSGSNNCLFYNNSIYVTDFVTNPGVENYLYGINVHRMTNLTIDSNRISMITTGGKLALGTAYPIQVNGPIMGVNITNNDLYSFSNGPNIGIYSVNYFGETSISITNNRINVTGLAGTDEWALVSGIESQDSNAEILNNQIEVHSVGDVGIYDNLFAISYRQGTDGSHTFNIQNNTAFTDGYMAVFLLGSYNSTILNNTLISFNANAETGSNSYGAGRTFSHIGDTTEGNTVINIKDYLATLNRIDGGSQATPISGESSTDIGGTGLNPQASNQYDSNPLIPGYFDTHGISDYSNDDDNTGIKDIIESHSNVNGARTSDSSKNSKSNDYVVMENIDSNEAIDSNSTLEKSNSNSYVSSNNTEAFATPDIIGDASPIGGVSSSAQATAQSVSKRAYEIEAMKNKEEFIPSTMIVVLTMVLLLVGYRRRDSNFE
ncbi:hypothetical protein [uncultured Methanobrevibacter sp.]|uniref:hypothetical protein n=1 Tax=uncultured Methanobrevibacter sp. TaxID=253161 RepID=UPI002613D338|nr:hypothetical protein [uncultured Methanobrevibacter sp.]